MASLRFSSTTGLGDNWNRGRRHHRHHHHHHHHHHHRCMRKHFSPLSSSQVTVGESCDGNSSLAQFCSSPKSRTYDRTLKRTPSEPGRSTTAKLEPKTLRPEDAEG
eukprot:6290175-Amphidinium_carterae.1